MEEKWIVHLINTYQKQTDQVPLLLCCKELGALAGGCSTWSSSQKKNE